MTDSPKFSAIPHEILLDGRLSYGARVLYGILQSHWWQGGECYASHTTLAAEMDCSPRQLQRYLSELVERSVIVERARGHGRAKAYKPTPTRQICRIESSNTTDMADSTRQIWPIQYDRSVVLDPPEPPSSEPNTTDMSDQHDISVAFNTTDMSTLRRHTEEDPPEEEDNRFTVTSPVVTSSPPAAAHDNDGGEDLDDLDFGDGGELALTVEEAPEAAPQPPVTPKRAAKPKRPESLLSTLSEPARQFVADWQEQQGRSQPPNINPALARAIEKAVLELGLDLLLEMNVWAAEREVPEIIKAIRAARTKRKQQEQDRAGNSVTLRPSNRRGAPAPSPEIAAIPMDRF